MLSQDENQLNNLIADIKGVGTALANKFAKLNLLTEWDLLLHLPKRYENRSQITPINLLQIGLKNLCQGEVVGSKVSGRKNNILTVLVKDKTGVLMLKFFHFSPYRARQYQRGVEVRCYGEVRVGQSYYEMVHPEIEFIKDDDSFLPDYLIAHYPSVEGLAQYKIQNIINPILDQLISKKILNDPIFEFISEISDKDNCLKLKKQVELLQSSFDLSIDQAIYQIHRPPLDSVTEHLEDKNTPFFKRLAVEELSAHRLGLLQLRDKINTCHAPKITVNQDKTVIQNFIKQLPFVPTESQYKCIDEILIAMKTSKPMMRLLQGDVGSGKTMVATAVILAIVEKGYKGLILVPTELLAKQHYQNLTLWLKPLNIEVLVMLGKQKAKEKKEHLKKLSEQKAIVIIGTHALFQKEIEISKLGLVVIDEQHRFGVKQRLNMMQKSENHYNMTAHQLLISATPIPRTLAMGLYGDLEQSVIDLMPAGRIPIDTKVIDNKNVYTLINAVNKQCSLGRQVYWVCPIIEESDYLNVKSASLRYLELCQMCDSIKIGLLHGKMKEDEKNEVIKKFREKKIDLLVATTVIEVGVDVPNASIIVIENAERMGLAQLHQLRGRVGRGTIKSQCLLVYQEPLSINSRQRLNALRASTDGFYLAEKDLQMRGSGEIIGVKQSGGINFKVADIQMHKALFDSSREFSELILNKSPEKVSQLLNRWNFQENELGKV